MQSLEPFSPQAQFHLLRHFYQPSQNYINELSRKLTVPSEELCKQFLLPASKFNILFAETPLALYRRIKEAQATQFHLQSVDTSSGKADYLIVFDAQYWPAGIGEDSVMPAEMVDKSLIDSIRLQQRDNLLVQTLAVSSLPKTFQMVLVVSEKAQVITAFPGRWLPPLSGDMIKDWIFLIRQ